MLTINYFSMKRLLKIIILATFIQTSLFSQTLSPVPTQFRTLDSTLIFNTNLFDIKKPIKGKLNGFNVVLISETHMDSINLKYLNFNVLKARIESQKFSLSLKDNELSQADAKIDKLTKDNLNQSMIQSITEEKIKNTDKIHKNEILYWKEKAKGKFTSFILGTSVGALIIAIITLVN